jgi:leucyl-tRNA synthetase
VRFPVVSTGSTDETRSLTVYTTPPGHAVRGARSWLSRPSAALARELVTDEQRPAYEAYLEETRKSSEIDRMATDRPKTGVFLGVHATNPVTGEQIPVWAADYVLAEYGTGAIMAVPGQDQRDWDFATKFDLPIVRTVQPPEGWEGEAYVGQGPAVNSSHDDISLDGMEVDEAKRTIIAWLEEKGAGEGTVNFRLRDWLLSRQRFWGVPIPIVHCPRTARSRCPTTSCRWSCRS